MNADTNLACVDVAVTVRTKTLLAPLSAVFAAGRFAAILGPNGAGKSTLLSVLGGQRRPSDGQVLLDGAPLSARSAGELALRRALMPQESAVAFEFSAQEIVALGRYPHRSSPATDESTIVPSAMALTDVGSLAHRVLNTLSGGEKARVHLARALAQIWTPRPNGTARWLLLDEPTAALDLAHQHAAMRLLRDRARAGIGVVAVLHDLNLARRYADDVVVLGGAAGIHAGPAAQVLEPALIAQVWGMPCQQVRGLDGTEQFLFG